MNSFARLRGLKVTFLHYLALSTEQTLVHIKQNDTIVLNIKLFNSHIRSVTILQRC